MMDHIEQRHGLDVLAGKVTCPICIEYSSTDRHTLSSHFARHMEEIALAIIPSAVESDYDSANETPSETQTDNIEDEPLPPQDYNSRSKVEAAYRYFGYDTPIITDLRDEHIVSKFKDFTAILSPALAEKARRQLQIIGNARNSAWIRATAGVALQHKVRVTPAHQSPGHPILDRFGATRLARESEKGNMEGVKEAYNEAPEELNYPDYAGITPLQKAAFRGWEDIVQYLLHKGCDTTCESGDRDTPLIDAVENSHLEVVRALLKANVDPHHINKRGQRAIDVLDYKDEDADEIVMLLRDAMGKHKHTEASPLKTSQLLYNEYNVETLEAKAASGDTGAVGELISSNIKPNLACGIAAAKGGHYNIFSIFLASGLRADYDPAKHKQTPMTAAIEGGHLQIVRLLLEQDGFNPTRRDSDDRTYYERAEGGKRLKNWKRLHDTLESAFMEYALRNKNIRPAEGPGPGPGPGPVVSYVQTEPMASSHTATQSPGPAPDRSPKIPHLPTVYPYSPSDLGVTGPWAPGLPKPIVVHDQTNLVGQNDYLALPSNTVDAETWISEASGFTHCDHCGAKFTGRYQRSSYARHVRQQHSEKEVQISANCVCRICAQQFKRQDARRRHEWDKHKLPDTKPLLRRPSKAVTANKVVSGVNEVNASEDDVP
jgi:ankyrin repeat protein